MRVATLVLIGSAALLWSTSASAGTGQPPMGQFFGAYYTCAQGQSFQVSYDSKAAKDATVTTSNNNHQYQLKRRSGPEPQFSNGTVTVSFSGDDAKVDGTELKLAGCKLKNPD